MLGNETQDVQAKAFVEWINTCPNVTHECHSVEELSNGIPLFEVLAEIDPVWFKLIRSADVGENWVLKINNLKKMHRMISRYYEDILGIPFERMPHVDLTAIAKDANRQEIFKLCQLVLFITVTRDNNAMVVERLQGLSEQSQRVVMLFIEEINRIRSATTGHGTPTASPLAAGTTDYTPRSSFADDTMYRNQGDLSRLAIEKEELETAHRKLIEEHAQLRFKFDELENEKGDLQLRLQEMDKAVTRANETGISDIIMRTELAHLKKDLEKSEDKRQEAEMLLEQQTLTIEDLTRRGQELKRQVEESAQLKDQLDEYRHIAEKLQKAENVIEKFKKKMEDSADLKRQVKGLEDQNHSLMERNQQIENEYRKVLAFKTLMDSYKDQVAMLETKNNELIREKNKREYDLQQMTKKIDMMEMDRARDSDRILTLEDHLQEAQLGVSRSTLQTESMDVDEEEDEDHNLDGSLEESLKETNVTELKRSKRRLERELRTLQEKSDIGSKSDKAMVLQHLLEDANRLKAQFERNYLEVSQERDILQSDMARVREGISDALLDDSDYTMSLRLHIIDLEKESKQLRADVSRLEDRVNDNGYHAPAHRPSFALAGIDQLEGGADIDAFKAQYKEMTTKQALLEEQTKKQLQDINKLLFEKDTLQRQHMDQKDQLLEKERLYSEMKASLAVFEAKDDEPVKKMVAQLQQQLVQKQEQFSETQAKLKRAREILVRQDQMVKDAKEASATNNYQELITSLQTEVAILKDENERCKKQYRESQLQSRREQQLMSSAWFDMYRQSRKEISKQYPTSWLAQQRTKH